MIERKSIDFFFFTNSHLKQYERNWSPCQTIPSPSKLKSRDRDAYNRNNFRSSYSKQHPQNLPPVKPLPRHWKISRSRRLYQKHPIESTVSSVAYRRMICGGNEHFNRRGSPHSTPLGATRFGAIPEPLKPVLWAFCLALRRPCTFVWSRRDNNGKMENNEREGGRGEGISSLVSADAHSWAT